MHVKVIKITVNKHSSVVAKNTRRRTFNSKFNYGTGHRTAFNFLQSTNSCIRPGCTDLLLVRFYFSPGASNRARTAAVSPPRSAPWVSSGLGDKRGN